MTLSKSKILLLSLGIIFVADNCFSQYSLEWTQRYPGSGPNSAFLWNMTMDKNENIFLVGERGSTIKYNSAGNLNWAINDSATFFIYSNTPSNLTTDDSGNVYVTGTATGAPFNLDFMTKKISASGVREWVRTYDNPIGASDRASNIINFRDKYIYVSGANSYGETGSCNFKWTTIKYDLNGNQLWTVQYCGNSDYVLGDYAPIPSMAVDSTGNIIISGTDIDRNSYEYQEVTIKYDSAGNQLWLKRMQNVYSTNAIAVDRSSNIYVGLTNGFIKYNPNGDLIWYDSLHTADFISIDTAGNVITSGNKYANQIYKIVTSKFDPPGNLLWSSETNTGYFIASMFSNNNGKTFIAANGQGSFYRMYHMFVYGPDGTQLWYGSYDDQVDTACIPIKIIADDNDNFYITGRSYGIGVWSRFLTLKYSIATNVNVEQSNNTGKFVLYDNYPNPFNPGTVISYSLIENGLVTLKVFDALGKEVATLVNGVQNKGSYNYQFSTVNYQLPSGTYLYKLEAGDFVQTKRMILLK